MTTPEDALEVLRKARMDLTAAQAKISDALNIIAKLPSPPRERHTCGSCQQHFDSQRKRDEHAYYHHAGPLPEHMQIAERLAGWH